MATKPNAKKTRVYLAPPTLQEVKERAKKKANADKQQRKRTGRQFKNSGSESDESENQFSSISCIILQSYSNSIFGHLKFSFIEGEISYGANSVRESLSSSHPPTVNRGAN